MIYTAKNTRDIGFMAKVFLDDREIHNAVIADTKNGKIIVAAYNRKGELSINWKDGIVRRKVLRGKVRVELSEIEQ